MSQVVGTGWMLQLKEKMLERERKQSGVVRFLDIVGWYPVLDDIFKWRICLEHFILAVFINW